MNMLLQRLTAAFGPPAHIKDLPRFVVEMEAQLVGFHAEALDRAATALIRHGSNRWPSPKAIVDACADAQEAMRAARPASILLEPRKRWPWEQDAERAEQWAKDFCAQSRWQEAIDEGWARRLKLWAQSFAQEHYRRGAEPELTARPTSDEIAYWRRYGREPAGAAIDDSGDFVDRVAEGAVDLNGIMAGALRSMAQAMKAKRDGG